MNEVLNTSDAAVSLAVLMPHAPVLVPPVGGRRVRDAASTVDAMRKVSQRVVEAKPSAVVLVSPHSPRKRGAFGVWKGAQVSGSFDPFGAPEVRLELPNASDLAGQFASEAQSKGVVTWDIEERSLDHGALVPLWFLVEAGWNGPCMVFSLNYPGEGGLTELGEVIARSASNLDQRIAFVASGDMSHALQPGAPCGYHPRAKEFDHQFIDWLRAGQYRETGKLDASLQELACEDVVDSTLVGVASAGFRSTAHEVLSYEGPFGVGYGVAVLFDALHDDAVQDDSVPGGQALPALARESVRASLLRERKRPPEPNAGYLTQRHGVFVTIRHRNGDLRGCVGTITPKCHDVAEETWLMAREAAFDDARFMAVQRHEVADLRFEVSVVHELEPVDSPADLDPSRYGVLIMTSDGRRAVLLPGIPEIKSVESQLRIARRKGHISEHESIRIQRFQVDHFEESA